MGTDLAFLSACDLAALLERREISPVDIVAAVLDRIDRYDGILRSYITVCDDTALQTARKAEGEIASGGQRTPLHGIPVSHKDISWTRGIATTAHSRSLLGFVPKQDATHVSKLRNAGAILIGKTNTEEFACGGTDIYGTPRNPWKLSHYTGGSSCGSASAVASGLAIVATGSDTGGSIRVPASFCGVVGLRPTFGRVSRYGVLPISWSMDQVGPMARTVRDCALMLGIMAGYDPLDRTTSNRPVPNFERDLQAGIEGIVLGLPQQHFYEELHPDVGSAVQAALKQLEGIGVRLEPMDLPRARHLSSVCRTLMMAEAFGQHAVRLREQGEDYGSRARRWIATGAFYTAAEYQQAAQARQLWIDELEEAMQHVDALVTPTVRFPAYTLAVEATSPPDSGANTYPFSLAGYPAISVPCGFTSDGLPIGLQLVAKPFDETALLRIAQEYQQASEWSQYQPDLRATRERA